MIQDPLRLIYHDEETQASNIWDSCNTLRYNSKSPNDQVALKGRPALHKQHKIIFKYMN